MRELIWHLKRSFGIADVDGLRGLKQHLLLVRDE